MPLLALDTYVECLAWMMACVPDDSFDPQVEISYREGIDRYWP
jgi:L-fucose mutarotase/ribose pyranase (RbsD/FucU family)